MHCPCCCCRCYCNYCQSVRLSVSAWGLCKYFIAYTYSFAIGLLSGEWIFIVFQVFQCLFHACDGFSTRILPRLSLNTNVEYCGLCKCHHKLSWSNPTRSSVGEIYFLLNYNCIKWSRVVNTTVRKQCCNDFKDRVIDIEEYFSNK